MTAIASAKVLLLFCVQRFFIWVIGLSADIAKSDEHHDGGGTQQPVFGDGSAVSPTCQVIVVEEECWQFNNALDNNDICKSNYSWIGYLLPVPGLSGDEVMADQIQ